MSLKDCPVAPMARTVNVRTEVSARALSSWNGDLAPRNETDSETSISVLDVIGEDIWGEGVTARRIAAALRRIGDRDVTVNINSPGGDFFEGLAIYNLLREHPAKVSVRILGLAASAASIIAMAGDDVQIAKAGFLMIHNTQVVGMGDRNDLRAIADWQEEMDAVLAEIFADRTGRPAAEITALLDGEEWLSGKRAVEDGFADDYLGADRVTEAAAGKSDAASNELRTVEAMMRRGNYTRSQTRDALNSLKRAMQDAGQPGTQDAAVAQGLRSLTTLARSMKET